MPCVARHEQSSIKQIHHHSQPTPARTSSTLNRPHQTAPYTIFQMINSYQYDGVIRLRTLIGSVGTGNRDLYFSYISGFKVTILGDDLIIIGFVPKMTIFLPSEDSWSESPKVNIVFVIVHRCRNQPTESMGYMLYRSFSRGRVYPCQRL